MSFLLFILNHISERIIVGFFELLRNFHRLFFHGKSPIAYSHYSIFEEGYIENQHLYKHIPYGKSNVSYAGCEVIATYNTLKYLGNGYSLPFSQVISDFSCDGMVFNGRFGSSPKAIADYLSQLGCDIIFSHHPNDFHLISHDCLCAVFTFFNDRHNLKGGIHTICLTKDSDGNLIAHNVHCNGSIMGPFKDFSEFLDALPSAKGICLIGILTA